MRNRRVEGRRKGVKQSVDRGKKTTNKTVRKRMEREARAATGQGSFDPVAWKEADKDRFADKMAVVAKRKAAKRAQRAARREASRAATAKRKSKARRGVVPDLDED